MVVALFVSLIVLMVIGVPLYIALAGSTLFSFALFSPMPLLGVAQKMFAGLDRFSLMAIPFFVLAANAMKSGGMAKRIIKLADACVGRQNGGIAFTTIVGCLFFGALCGSAPATIVALGSMLYPAMIEKRYGEDFSIGLLCSTASVALLIPPSLTMIVYGSVTGASVGELFIGGFGAGIIYAVPFFIYSWQYAKHHGVLTDKVVIPGAKIKSLKDAGWALGVPVIIIGGIYTGLFTPTEAAAVSACYAIIVGMFVYKEMDLKGLLDTCIDSAVSTAMIMIMISSAMVFSWILVVDRIPQRLAGLMLSLSTNKYLILFMMNIIMLVAGMFVDGSAFILILGPLFMPIAEQVGINLVQLGIIMVTNGCIGMFTPPFGLNLFVGSNISKLPYSRVVKGIWPFIIISLVALAVITYFPQSYMWLPNLAYHR
jgi:C4-dicarboxylate transporter DctM subunit